MRFMLQRRREGAFEGVIQLLFSEFPLAFKTPAHSFTRHFRQTTIMFKFPFSLS